VATPAQTIVQIRLTKSMAACLNERLSRRNIGAEDYLIELIQADVAPLRLEAWRDKFPPAPAEEKKIETKGRQEVAAGRVQRVLHLHEQAISDGNISQRLGLSVMTIRRILKEHAQSDHVQRSGPAGRARSRGARFWEQ
jgi:hypothetical protein